jgi:hypothetical protein
LRRVLIFAAPDFDFVAADLAFVAADLDFGALGRASGA